MLGALPRGWYKVLGSGCSPQGMVEGVRAGVLSTGHGTRRQGRGWRKVVGSVSSAWCMVPGTGNVQIAWYKVLSSGYSTQGLVEDDRKAEDQTSEV